MADLIERSGAIDELKDMYQAAEKWGREADDDVIKARAESCMASLIEMKLRIENLPPAQPEQNVGKWTMTVDRGGFTDWFCSSCGGSGRGDYHFCPWCSAKMEEQDGNA